MTAEMDTDESRPLPQSDPFSEMSSLLRSLPPRPGPDSLPKLERLRDVVRSLRPAELKPAGGKWTVGERNLGLVSLFDCVLAAPTSGIESNADGVRDSLAALGEIVTTFLNSMEPDEILTVAGPYLVGFLTHPFPLLRSMALDQVTRAVHSPELIRHPLVLKSAVMCVADEDLGVATKAIHALSSVEPSVLFQDPDLVVNELVKLMDRSEIIKFRVFEWSVRVASTSESALAHCATPFLKRLLDEFRRGDDVLSRLNSLTLLTDAAATPHGFKYLEDQGIFALLEAYLKEGGSDGGLMAAFIVPGLMKFFGTVVTARSRDPQWDAAQFLSRYSGFLDCVYSGLGSSDPSILYVSLDTVGHLGTTRRGKLALHRSGIDRQIGGIFRMAESGSSETRVKALECLAELISVEGMGVSEGDEVTDVTNSWFRLFQQNPMSKVLAICHLPFTDIRNAGLRVLDAVATQKWGLNAINASPGLAEFLLDRAPVKDKEGKEAMFKIVSTIVNHPESMGIFGQVKMASFRRFVREGPFYVAVQAEVAMEGE